MKISTFHKKIVTVRTKNYSRGSWTWTYTYVSYYILISNDKVLVSIPDIGNEFNSYYRKFGEIVYKANSKWSNSFIMENVQIYDEGKTYYEIIFEYKFYSRYNIKR